MISGDGRFVVMDSISALASRHQQHGRRLPVQRETNSHTFVSHTVDGAQANGRSNGAAISADGRWIAVSQPGDESRSRRHERASATSSCSTVFPARSNA
jgi:hypothetical protein